MAPDAEASGANESPQRGLESSSSTALKTWLLRELFAHRLGADRVDYVDGVLRGLRGLVRDDSGAYHWVPVSTTPAVLAERVKEVIPVEKGVARANGVIPLIRRDLPVSGAHVAAVPPAERQCFAMKPR